MTYEAVVRNGANREMCIETYSDECDHEEPHSQYPEEESDNKSKGPEKLCIDEAITLQVEVVREGVGHTKQSQAGERGRANSNEHGSSMLAVGISNLHETANVVCVHEYSDSET